MSELTPDDQLREKVAEALTDYISACHAGGSVPRTSALADVAIAVMAGVSATPAPPERDLWAATIRAAEEVVEARGFTDADVERVALVLAAHDDESFNDVARAVLAAIGPKEGTDS